MANNLQRQKVSPDTWIKLGIWVGAGVGIAFGVKKVLDYFKPERKRDESEKKDIESELEAEAKKNKATYPKSQYAAFCSTIAEAIFGGGTDEAAIYNVFRSLKNDTDYLSLVKAWGSPTRQVFPDYFVFYSTGKKLTLPAALRYDLEPSECAKINAILKSKGIKYRI
jgi:hypothetical protein